MAQPTFFLKTVPLLDGGDDVALVLTPQAFHNLVRIYVVYIYDIINIYIMILS